MSYLSVGRVLKERFVVGQSIGSGAYGVVHEVTDQRDHDKPLAVKCVRTTAHVDILEFCTIEKKILERASAENKSYFPKYVDYFEILGQSFLVLSLEGENLRVVRFKNTGLKISPSNSSKIFISLVKGLSYLHSLGFIHRDIHDGNVVVSNPISLEAPVKILDFGYAREIDTDQQKRENIQFHLGSHQSLDVALGKPPAAIDDFIGLYYLILDLNGNSTLFEGTPDVIIQKKIQFNDNLTEHLARTPWLISPVSMINSFRNDGNFNSESLIGSIKKAWPAEYDEPISFKIDNTGTRIY